jgi:hypothetical protein
MKRAKGEKIIRREKGRKNKRETKKLWKETKGENKSRKK